MVQKQQLFLRAALLAVPAYGVIDLPQRLLYNCPYSDAAFQPCCGVLQATMEIALDHLKSKDGSLIPEVATELTNDDTSNLFSISTTDTGDMYNTIKAFPTPGTTGDLDLIVGAYWSSHVAAMSAYLNTVTSKGIPIVGAGAASPLFVSSPQEYPHFWNVYPSDAQVVITLAAILRQKLGWTDLAILYDQGDPWSLGCRDYFRKGWTANGGDVSKITEYNIPYGSLAPAKSAVKQLPGGLARSIVSFQFESELKVFMELAMEAGIAGPGEGAREWAYVSLVLGGQGTLLPSHFEGMMGIGSVAALDTRYQKLKDIWQSTVFNRTLMGPHDFLSVPDRVTMAPKCDYYPAVLYDAIIVSGVATARAARSTSSSATIEEEFAKGITLQALSGDLSFQIPSAGFPWSPRQNNFKYSLSTVDDTHKVKRIRTFSNVSEITAADIDSMHWPGGFQKTPPSVLLNSACYKRYMADPTFSCHFGTCSNTPRPGQKAGSCVCTPHYLGPFCNLDVAKHGDMDRAPLSVSNEPLDVYMIVELASFKGFSKDGTKIEGIFSLTLEFDDPRIMVDDGEYKYMQAQGHVSNGNLWLPEMQLPECVAGTITGHVTVKYPKVTMKVNLPADQCKVSVDWQFFPFDDQKVDMVITPSDVSQFVFRQHTTPPSYPTHVGIPQNVLDMSWTEMWPLVESKIEFEGKGSAVYMKLEVKRNPTQLMVRVVLPLAVLTIISWSGFYIRVAALMPRFASGFISFLALNSFKGTVTKEMPSTMASVSWFDIVLSIVTFLMGGAVVQNVSTEYVNSGWGEVLASEMDRFARIAFPSYTLVLWILLLLGLGKDNILGILAMELFTIGHIVIAIMAFHTITFSCSLVTNFKHLLLCKAVDKCRSESERLPESLFGEKESKMLFKAFEDEAVVRVDEAGEIVRDDVAFEEWIMMYLQAELEGHVEGQTAEKKLRDSIKNEFYNADITFDQFKARLPVVLRSTFGGVPGKVRGPCGYWSFYMSSLKNCKRRREVRAHAKANYQQRQRVQAANQARKHEKKTNIRLSSPGHSRSLNSPPQFVSPAAPGSGSSALKKTSEGVRAISSGKPSSKNKPSSRGKQDAQKLTNIGLHVESTGHNSPDLQTTIDIGQIEVELHNTVPKSSVINRNRMTGEKSNKVPQPMEAEYEDDDFLRPKDN